MRNNVSHYDDNALPNVTSLDNHYGSGHTDYTTQAVTTYTRCNEETTDFKCVCFLNSCSEIVRGCTNIGQQLQNIDLTLTELCDDHRGFQRNGHGSIMGKKKIKHTQKNTTIIDLQY